MVYIYYTDVGSIMCKRDTTSIAIAVGVPGILQRGEGARKDGSEGIFQKEDEPVGLGQDKKCRISVCVCVCVHF